jgi:hypothetical protein
MNTTPRRHLRALLAALLAALALVALTLYLVSKSSGTAGGAVSRAVWRIELFFHPPPRRPPSTERFDLPADTGRVDQTPND